MRWGAERRVPSAENQELSTVLSVKPSVCHCQNIVLNASPAARNSVFHISAFLDQSACFPAIFFQD